MKPTPPRWPDWEERLRCMPPGSKELRGELTRIAEEVSRAIGRQGALTERWRRVGVNVHAVHMRGRGRCDISAVSPLVFVREGDNTPAQHFTVAHEVAHLLVNSLPEDRLAAVGHRGEERLCDEFARNVLVPPAELAEKLGDDPTPSPEGVFQLCGSFGANPSVVLRALADHGSLGAMSYVLARKRGHYRRPAIVDFRVDGAIGPMQVFWPHHRRLRGLGLTNLADAAAAAAHGTYFEGSEERMVIPRSRLDEQTGGNAMVGAVHWRAGRQGKGKPYLLARIDCGSLRAERVRLHPGADGERGAGGVPAAPAERVATGR